MPERKRFFSIDVFPKVRQRTRRSNTLDSIEIDCTFHNYVSPCKSDLVDILLLGPQLYLPEPSLGGQV